MNDVLEPNATRQRVIEAGESLTHMFVDVSGTGTLNVTTSLVGRRYEREFLRSPH